MRKIKNPYTKIEGYCCFGCSPDNHNGLRMDFFEDGEEIYSEWDPVQHFQGYINVLHGGIQSTLMDEIACWAVLIKLKTGAVTAAMDIRLKRTVHTDKGKIKLRASIAEVNRRIAKVKVNLYDAEDTVCASGIISYYMFPLEESVKNLCYPADYSGFFE